MATNVIKRITRRGSKPSKRQRKEYPPSWLENESLAVVASPLPGEDAIRTPVASSAADKGLFLERFQKEIINRFQFSLSVSKKEIAASLSSSNNSKRLLLKQRLKIGTNPCTRILEKAAMAVSKNADDKNKVDGIIIPSLIVMARDIYPPTILSHIPILAKQVKTPILLLGGQASIELGKMLGTKRVSILLFVPPNRKNKEISDLLDARLHDDIDSFIQFVLRNILDLTSSSTKCLKSK